MASPSKKTEGYIHRAARCASHIRLRGASGRAPVTARVHLASHLDTVPLTRLCLLETRPSLFERTAIATVTMSALKMTWARSRRLLDTPGLNVSAVQFPRRTCYAADVRRWYGLSARSSVINTNVGEAHQRGPTKVEKILSDTIKVCRRLELSSHS